MILETKDALVEDIKLKSALAYRKILLWDDITEESCLKTQYFIERIIREDESDGISPKDAEPITIAISSYGGSLLDCNSLISYMEQVKEMGYTIKTIAEGKAMSAGSMILAMGSEGHRQARRYATIMVHQLSAGCGGTISEMETQVREFRRLWDLMKELLVHNTNMTTEKVDEIFERNQDLYLSPMECVELGIIDEII